MLCGTSLSVLVSPSPVTDGRAEVTATLLRAHRAGAWSVRFLRDGVGGEPGRALALPARSGKVPYFVSDTEQAMRMAAFEALTVRVSAGFGPVRPAEAGRMIRFLADLVSDGGTGFRHETARAPGTPTCRRSASISAGAPRSSTACPRACGSVSSRPSTLGDCGPSTPMV